ncbi:hypothetical protein S100390_v1c05030 [Spiroplasma sp. NBRC 100390]|uniref:hypothetical protein n=1 Tax=unclassified Spiroplasma TaxID=2637901 RepID=UPI000892A428|nr:MULTISPECIES: hypothetical protein [unclassified Spiroplasma]AOX43843.1 hypothetical protein STU14_v1c05030 [Spiroplasma sp. TU-14]APE13313.1 hypothetical protein S100390_v1c05030 [Spiroplasma sp. NBRC 100390]
MPVSNIVGCRQQTNEEEASPEKAIAASVNNLLDKVKYDVSSKGFVFKEGDGSVKSQIEILELWLGPKNPDLGIIKDDLFLMVMPILTVSDLNMKNNNRLFFFTDKNDITSIDNFKAVINTGDNNPLQELEKYFEKMTNVKLDFFDYITSNHLVDGTNGEKHNLYWAGLGVKITGDVKGNSKKLKDIFYS